jgi:SAM-dependent methyltransferase
VSSTTLRRSIRRALVSLPDPVRRRVEIKLLRAYEAYARAQTYARVRTGKLVEPTEAGGYPVPPAKLRVLVSGTADPDFFLDSGRRQAELFREIYERHAGPIEPTTTILDFGCGCGRLARWWADARPALHGCDPNATLVAWVRANLPFVTATVSSPDPPLPYAEGTFDFVYALSIFTHLPAHRALPWMTELRRVTKPGGLILFTTAGEAYRERLTEGDGARYDRGEEVTQFDSASGTNLCIVYQPPAYVRERMLEGLDLVQELLATEDEERARNLQLVQDCYLARAPAPERVGGS